MLSARLGGQEMHFDRLRRREFIAGLGSGAVAWPLAARAQQREHMRRIGALSPGVADDAEYQARNAAFLQSLGELGWSVGRNVRIDYRWRTWILASGSGSASFYVGSRSVPSTAGHRYSKSASRWSPRSNSAWIRCCASGHVSAV
jgi:hypothetical protein